MYIDHLSYVFDNPINRLPTDILGCIVSFLDIATVESHIRPLNGVWKNAVDKGYKLRGNTDDIKCQIKTNDSTLTSIAKRYPRLRSIDLSKCNLNTSTSFKSEVAVSVTGVISFIQKSKKLHNINLNFCDNKLPIKVIMALKIYTTGLHTLGINLTHDSTIKIEDILLFAKTCSSLRVLDIQFCTCNESCMMDIQSQLPNIKINQAL